MMIPKRETPQTIEERGTVKAKYAHFLGPVLFGMVMIVALCAFVPFLASFQHEGRWEPGWGWWVYIFATFTLTWMIRITA